MTAEAATGDRNKATVRRLVEEVLNGGRLEVIDELYVPDLATGARDWIAPFRASFPDVRVEIIELIAEGDTVAGHCTCSATHTGTWLGRPAAASNASTRSASTGSATQRSPTPGRLKTTSPASGSSG
jgi:hypothetical protein